MSDASPSVPARPSLAAVPRPVEVSDAPLAFEDFYRREHRHVLGLAYVLTGNQSAAEDVTQEVFLEVWRKAPSFDGTRGSAKTWVMTIAHRRAVDAVRREQERVISNG